MYKPMGLFSRGEIANGKNASAYSRVGKYWEFSANRQSQMIKNMGTEQVGTSKNSPFIKS